MILVVCMLALGLLACKSSSVPVHGVFERIFPKLSSDKEVALLGVNHIALINLVLGIRSRWGYFNKLLFRQIALVGLCYLPQLLIGLFQLTIIHIENEASG